MSTNLPSFNFTLNPVPKDVTREIKLDEQAIRSELQEKELLSEKVKATLMNGGSIVLEEAEIERNIEINSNLLVSYKDIKNKFTNFINIKGDNDHIKHNLDRLQTDIEFITKNLKEVSFDTKHSMRIKSILNHYESSAQFRADDSNLFKVDGDKTKESIGQRVETANRFRVYLSVDNEPNVSTTYKLIFFDVHHLAIPSKHRGLDPKTMQERTFTRCQYYKHHIKELFE